MSSTVAQRKRAGLITRRVSLKFLSNQVNTNKSIGSGSKPDSAKLKFFLEFFVFLIHQKLYILLTRFGLLSAFRTSAGYRMLMHRMRPTEKQWLKWTSLVRGTDINSAMNLVASRS